MNCYWLLSLSCHNLMTNTISYIYIPNFSEIGQFLQKLSHFIEFRLVGWLGWLGPSDFKKISRWKADGHNISAYKKSSWYLKALKSYPILKLGGNDDHDHDHDHDDDTIGGWIIVRSVLTPSRTIKSATITLVGSGIHCIYKNLLNSSPMHHTGTKIRTSAQTSDLHRVVIWYHGNNKHYSANYS